MEVEALSKIYSSVKGSAVKNDDDKLSSALQEYNSILSAIFRHQRQHPNCSCVGEILDSNKESKKSAESGMRHQLSMAKARPDGEIYVFKQKSDR